LSKQNCHLMQLTHRHLESIPYLSLFGLLVALLLTDSPDPYYALLVIPIAMAAVLHQLIGGTLAALTASVSMIAAMQLQSAASFQTSLFAETWPIIAAFLVIGPGFGWLADRERTRQRAADAAHSRAVAAIHDAGQEIAATQDLDRTLRQLMIKAAETLPMDAGILFLRDEETQVYRVAVSHNLPQNKVEKITFAFDEGVPGWVVQHERPLIINNASQDSRVHNLVLDAGVHAVLAVPLVTRRQTVGVLNLFCYEAPNAFDDEALRLAQVFADQAAVFIENARLVDQLRQAAAELEARVERRTTQLKEKQAQVIRAEKMAAVGRLAGSVAHEVNNPLQAITLHLQLIAEDGLSPDSQSQLAIVQHELDRIANLVQRLLDFQRPKHGEKTCQHVSQLLEDVLTLAGKQLQQGQVTAACDINPSLPTIMAVGDQIKQVFLNLVLNAAQAMPEGGTLEISAQPQQEQMVIRFMDSGCGIAPEAMAHLFEPFFSTKHSGTGLGLAVSQEIVAAHGGQLTAVNNQTSPGATFIVTLPLC
jgi:signal transduction histidine kinase